MGGQLQGWKCLSCGFVNPRTYSRCVTCLNLRTYEPSVRAYGDEKGGK